MIKGVSMFASSGIGETYFKKAGIDIVVANELLPKRGQFYKEMNPNSNMIIGDIRDKNVKKELLSNINDEVKFLIATPPCQGISNLGKNRTIDDKLKDSRNYLIFEVLEVIDKKNFDYIMIENVPGFLKVLLPYKDELRTIEEILNDKYSKKYIIESKILNAKDYGVPQSRPRAIVKMYKKGLKWGWPKPQKEITLREAIGDLPSLESGETSNIKFHNAKIHNEREIECMKYTAEGFSAMTNEVHYPKKADGSRIKGFHNTYKRMKWDAPAPARTMNNGNIGSHNNVHPGRKNPDGTYSDARVLTLRELFIVSSLPAEWDIPEGFTDTFIRHIIGEAIPPMLSYNIVNMIGEDEND